MEGFKNTTRMKTFGDEAPQAYAKGGSVKPMVKAAAKAPAKKADAKYPVKRKDGDLANMTPAERRASMEQTSRAMTPAQTRSLQALKTAKAAAPKQGPLIKPAREMTPAERRMNQMDRPTNSRGAEAYKGGGKVGGSKVPFAVKKVMRKAEGGAIAAPKFPPMPEMPNQPAPPPPMPASGYPDPNITAGMMPVQNPDGSWRAQPLPKGPSPEELAFSKWAQSQNPQPQSPQEPTPQSVFGKINPDLYGTSPGPMPTMPNEPMMPSAPMGAGPEARPAYESMPEYIAMQKQMADLRAQDAAGRAQLAAQDRAATLQAQQEMAAQAQMDRGLGLDLGGRRNTQAPMYGRGAPPRFMR